jgi:hypothetical protein
LQGVEQREGRQSGFGSSASMRAVGAMQLVAGYNGLFWLWEFPSPAQKRGRLKPVLRTYSHDNFGEYRKVFLYWHQFIALFLSVSESC